MKIEKISEIKAPGDGILSVSFQPHPIEDDWDFERVAICGEKGVHIWLFDYQGNHRRLAFIESSTCSIIKMCRWSQDGKYLAVVDMEQIAVYHRGEAEIFKASSFSSRGFSVGMTDDKEDETNEAWIETDRTECFENWVTCATFSSSDVNECADICWLKGSKVLVNGTISGHIIVYNMEERSQSCNLFIRDILETGFRKRGLNIAVPEVGHVTGLSSDTRGFFLASQMSTRKLLIFDVTYNKQNGKEILSKRNCVTLSFLLEEERLIINAPCILTFIRRPIFDPLACLVGCPYGEVGTSYFSCLFPFRDISDSKPFGWEELCRLVNYESGREAEKLGSDIWSLHSEGKSRIKDRLEFPEAFRLRGHQRRVRIFQFTSTVLKEKDEIFSLCAQSSQDGSLSLWKVIYDLGTSSKIKSIECFLVLTNFMDEQASVTDIAFNNLNNTILIGSDDNKLTLLNFEFEEFSLAKPTSKALQDFYLSSWNFWCFEFRPEKPSNQSLCGSVSHTKDSGGFSRHISLPSVSTSDLREFQERTQEAVISSKGTKIRRIQPLNLTEMYAGDSRKSGQSVPIREEAPFERISSQTLELDSNKHRKTQDSRDTASESGEKKGPSLKGLTNPKNSGLQGEESENKSPQKAGIHEENNAATFGLSRDLEEKEDGDSRSGERAGRTSQDRKSTQDWLEDIQIPQRLVVDTKIQIGQEVSKVAVFVDNRQVIRNLNRSRSCSTEIICMKQEQREKQETSNPSSKDVLWYKPINTNSVVTHMIRIKDILLVLYSGISGTGKLITGSNLEFLSLSSGSSLVGGICLPYVLKLVISETLDLVLLVMANGKIRTLRINGFLSCSTELDLLGAGSFGVSWILDADYSFLSPSRLSRVDLYSGSGDPREKSEAPTDPIIILYFEDGWTFCYSFDASTFIRIDDLEHQRSDFWSLTFPKTILQLTRENEERGSQLRSKALEQISEAASPLNQGSKVEVSSVCLDPRSIQSDFGSEVLIQKCFFLREIQQNSRLILLNHQHSKTSSGVPEGILSLFENILSTSLFDDYSEGEDEAEAEKKGDGGGGGNEKNAADWMVLKTFGSMKGKRDMNDNLADTKLHIEHQLMSSIIVKSRNEFKYWFKIYVKFALDSLDLDLIREISSRVLQLTRESILCSPKGEGSKGLKGSETPFWFNLKMLESMDLDPTLLLSEDVVSTMQNFRDILGQCSNIGLPQVGDFEQELGKLKEQIEKCVQSIHEELEASKNDAPQNSQGSLFSQNPSLRQSSHLDFLDSIFF
ncbi:WD domain, G-beta repeat-containing protein [Cryptosporidium felis]|nr:WD domain, G-beta repeat-containing protein [Cryptosporidium felis]